MPAMKGWGSQWYVKLPASPKVVVNARPGSMSPDAQLRESEELVWLNPAVA